MFLSKIRQTPPIGFGVVFSLNALAFLERDVPDFHALLIPRLESWPMQRIVHRDEQVEIDGNGFSAIGRLELNQFLQELCAAAGVEIEYHRVIASIDEVSDCDLLVGADGANSFIRRALEAEFETELELAHQSLCLVWHPANVRVSELDLPRECGRLVRRASLSP